MTDRDRALVSHVYRQLHDLHCLDGRQLTDYRAQVTRLLGRAIIDRADRYAAGELCHFGIKVAQQYGERDPVIVNRGDDAQA